MALLDLLKGDPRFHYYGKFGKFTQKSLQFDMDRPGGGSSGQPYVQAPFPEVANQDFKNLYAASEFGTDFPIRGGMGLSLGEVGPYATQAAKFDKERIQKFLTDAPRGPVFLLKQAALQLTNPKIQVGSQINPNIGEIPFRLFGTLENTRIYNEGGNTLVQVAAQGSGTHLDRHGVLAVNPIQQTYNFVANDRNKPLTTTGGQYGENRLYTLYRTKILGNTTVPNELLSRLGISKNGGLLFDYPGGPTSIGGVGSTIVQRRYISPIPVVRLKPDYVTGSAGGQGPAVLDLYTGLIASGKGSLTSVYKYDVDPVTAYSYKGGAQTVTINRTTNTVASTEIVNTGDTIGTTNETNVSFAYTYAQLASQDKNVLSNIKQDFRTTFKGLVTSTIGYEGAANIQQSALIGDPGKRGKPVNYNIKQQGTQDEINLLDINQTADVHSSGVVGRVKDLITFRFDTIEVDDNERTALIFRAFLTGLTDNHTAEWSPYKYVGRGENFYSYNGFTRAISFNFKIAAQSREEMRPLYRKLNYLVSQLYPDYDTFTKSKNSGFMRAPIVRLTIGDYINAQPGFLTSMNITVPDDAPWEIANDPILDKGMDQLPQMLDVSCQFTPIHDFLPRRSWIETKDKNNIHITPLIGKNLNKMKASLETGEEDILSVEGESETSKVTSTGTQSGTTSQIDKIITDKKYTTKLPNGRSVTITNSVNSIDTEFLIATGQYTTANTVSPVVANIPPPTPPPNLLTGLLPEQPKQPFSLLTGG